jgi:hypothetical protein
MDRETRLLKVSVTSVVEMSGAIIPLEMRGLKANSRT